MNLKCQLFFINRTGGNSCDGCNRQCSIELEVTKSSGVRVMERYTLNMCSGLVEFRRCVKAATPTSRVLNGT